MPVNKVTYRLAATPAAFLLRVFGRLVVHGRENVPATGPVILVSNHLSHLDPPLLGTVCGRYVCFMAKEELFRVPGLGWWIAQFGAFPVRRGAADRAALRQAQQVLREGGVLAIFPEGHRSEDGHLQVGEDGAGLIALRARVPIVPAGITGTNTVLPPHSVRLRFGRVSVRFGAPFTLDDLYGQTGRESVSEATRRIMAAIAALLPPQHQPHPPQEVPGPGVPPGG